MSLQLFLTQLCTIVFRVDTGNNRKIVKILEIAKQLLSNFKPWNRKFAKKP